MNPEHLQIEIDAARWGAAHANRWVVVNAALMSVALFFAIVLWRPWLFVSAGWLALQTHELMRQRNRDLLRLHRLGAQRWMGAPAGEFGRAVARRAERAA